MDDQRKIRFLFPPLILASSLAFGAYLDHRIAFPLPPDSTGWGYAISLITASAAVVLAIGYLLGTISGALFSVLFRIKHFREVNISEDALTRIMTSLCVPGGATIRDPLYPIATFDHACIHPHVHAWLQRRWQTCYTSMNCTVALMAALVLGTTLGVAITWRWALITIILVGALLLHVWRAWHDAMYMLEFQSYGPFPAPADSKKA